jgi:hypothetical protein
VVAAMERHLAMICQNHTDSCHPWHHGKARTTQTSWRRNDTAGSLPFRCGHRIPYLTPSPPSTPLVPPGHIQGTKRSPTDNLPATNADSHVPLPTTQPVNVVALAEDRLKDEGCDSELLTEERTSRG